MVPGSVAWPVAWFRMVWDTPSLYNAIAIQAPACFDTLQRVTDVTRPQRNCGYVSARILELFFQNEPCNTMPQPPGALRLQAGLLVVFLYVLQTGLWGLVFHAFPVAPFAVHPGVTSVECMLTLIAGGVAIVWLARRRPGKPFLLRKSAVIAGV